MIAFYCLIINAADVLSNAARKAYR